METTQQGYEMGVAAMKAAERFLEALRDLVSVEEWRADAAVALDAASIEQLFAANTQTKHLSGANLQAVLSLGPQLATYMVNNGHMAKFHRIVLRVN